MNSTTASRPSFQTRKRRRKLYYTVDVLTDGSEWTGDGTLFLSVYKEQPKNGAADDQNDVHDDAVTNLQSTEANFAENKAKPAFMDGNQGRSHYQSPALARY